MSITGLILILNMTMLLANATVTTVNSCVVMKHIKEGKRIDD